MTQRLQQLSEEAKSIRSLLLTSTVATDRTHQPARTCHSGEKRGHDCATLLECRTFESEWRDKSGELGCGHEGIDWKFVSDVCSVVGQAQ